MKIYPECIPCLLKRVLYEVNLVDEAKGYEAMKRALEVMVQKYHPNVVSVDLATDVHHAVYELLGVEDPYRDMKERSNATAMALRPKVEEYLSRFERGTIDALRAHAIVAIIGNVLDFGIRGGISSPEALEAQMEHMIAAGLGWDDTSRVHEILSSSKEGVVIYVGDNAGEIIFDTYMVSYIKETYNRDVIYVVRGGPILSDATMADAELSGMTKIASKVLTTNSRYVGINLDEIDNELWSYIEQRALFIAKGMANFEALSERHGDIAPVVYMLRTKCRPVAESLGVDQDKSIVKIYEE